MSEMLVTVTYGKRWHLLREALAAGFREGCERAIVVINGQSDTSPHDVYESFGEHVDLIVLMENTGSANGYAVGINAALKSSAAYILLLDDDNALEPGALAALRKAHHELSAETEADDLIAVCFRREHNFDVTTGKIERRVRLSRNSFLCFHIKELPSRLWRRAQRSRRSRKARHSTCLPEHIERASAPYGGMYFHRSLPEKHGYPDNRFVLYADDIEYSERISRNGGKIWLITDARLIDLESSWNARSNFGSGFEALLLGGTDLRAYYNCRNYTYFEKECTTIDPAMRSINRFLCLALLWLMAARHGAFARYRLLLRAIEDGENGRLGIHPEFPLP
jgi:GT2 family glycosyltransferase